MCCGSKPLHSILALGTVLILAFDVATNWFAFAKFQIEKTVDDDADEMVTIFLGIAASFGSVLWFIAIRNMVAAFKACGKEEDQESVARWEESTSFFQLILQDTAMVVIIYVGFNSISCPLFLELYQNSFTAELALIGALSGSVWKIVRGVFNCLCCCMSKPDTGCGWGCFCFIFRIVTAVLALGIIAFVVYQLFMVNGETDVNRNDCLNMTVVTTASGP
ncbi:hypothetical protein LSH36_1249g00043 [Paralvinella palmiformis]|uniref:Uncharacterized protein n=1 Tax=Paralvinella palmiformis TaxID=53620 RepID=A0AAD9IV27_9ANNE|nr:hypothetical protein LSH36_1249g00043 [Paralvinella palmiformis]